MKTLIGLVCAALVPASAYSQGLIAGGAPSSGRYSSGSDSKQEMSPEEVAKYGNLAVCALIPRLHDIDPRVRQATLTALQALGPMAKPAIPAIVDLLRDPDSFVRIDAVQTAVKLGDDTVPYLAVLLHDEIGEVRYLAARAIEELDPPPITALPALMASLRDIDPRVRQVCIFALEKMGAAAKPAIMAIADLFHDPDSYVRIDAARTLSEMGPEAVPALALLLCDANGNVRESAAETLQKIAADMPRSLTAMPQ